MNKRSLKPAILAATLVAAAISLIQTPSATAAATCSIRGTAGADVLRGTSRNDVICGYGGKDRLIGSGGSDTLIGGDGADTLDGGAGADNLNGGTGRDTATYATRTTVVTADLDGRADDGARGEGDRIQGNVESLAGGAAADRLTGGSASNLLAGNGGDDVLDGGAGNDNVRGNTGTDNVDGGSGSDAIDTGPGGGESIDGDTGIDKCTDPDATVARPSNCETTRGWGVYGRVTLTPPDVAGPGRFSGSTREAHVATMSNGDIVAVTHNTRGVPGLTRLDSHGNAVTSFGNNGWVMDIAQDAGYGYLDRLTVKDDLIYVSFFGGYILRVDGTGARDTAFGTNGLVDLASVISPERPDLNGTYRPRYFDDHIAFGYNGSGTGIIRIDYTGRVVSRKALPAGVIDGDLAHDILPLATGGGLVLTKAGNVYGYDADLQTDTTFGTNGVVSASTSDRFGGDPDRIRSALIETPNGWARLSITGTLKPDDLSGVPKVDEFLPQHLLQENFTENGAEEDAAFGWAWAAAALPPETERCDSAAAGVHSADTRSTDILSAGALIPVRRCSDTVWVRFDQTGNSAAINRTGINVNRRADTSAIPSGELLAYADNNGKATLDLLKRTP